MYINVFELSSRKEKAPFLSRLKAGVPWRGTYGTGCSCPIVAKEFRLFWPFRGLDKRSQAYATAFASSFRVDPETPEAALIADGAVPVNPDQPR